MACAQRDGGQYGRFLAVAGCPGDILSWRAFRTRAISRERAPFFLPEQILSGRLMTAQSPRPIVETEAYLGPEDLGRPFIAAGRPRNRGMFMKPGTLYVYLIYGRLHRTLSSQGEEDRGRCQPGAPLGARAGRATLAAERRWGPWNRGRPEPRAGGQEPAGGRWCRCWPGRTPGATVGRQWCDPFGVRWAQAGASPVGSHEVSAGPTLPRGKHAPPDAQPSEPWVLLASLHRGQRLRLLMTHRTPDRRIMAPGSAVPNGERLI